ncbi:MAG: DUF504 domain-containing protein [Nanoarchaeota archaeon]|nr:DUF504 domain-containing protein [Nanoarchaeota archaeon]MBU1623131.1 DUF504 domain-containing protein [Nanoarchaeota archaeon]MBU1973837.1 DUF504 domain-containing protein [Nanoarchaeota archaeon]
MREQDRHFLLSILMAIGIILVWKGLWEGLYEVPYLGNPWVALFIGFALLTFSGLIFKEFDPLGNVEKSITKNLNFVKNHPKKHLFEIHYKDKSSKKNVIIKGHQIKGFEKNTLVLKDAKKKEEFFIPFHRIDVIKHQGKVHWRL